MTGALTLLQRWLAALTEAAARLPALAAGVGASSWPLAALGLLLGLALLVAGARLGRILAATGGALVGWLAAGALGGPEAAAPGFSPATVAWGAAGVLGVACALAPAVYPLVLGIVPGALLGFQVPLGGRPWVGAAAGAVVLALFGLLVRRIVLAATAAISGAALLGASLLALAARFPALGILSQRPLLLAGACAVLAVAGTAFQLETQTRAGDARRARAME